MPVLDRGDRDLLSGAATDTHRAAETADDGPDVPRPLVAGAPRAAWLRDLLHYWQTRAAGALPSRAAIDPTEMWAWLPRIGLLDVDDRALHGRVIGTGLDILFEVALTGKPMDSGTAGPVGKLVIATAWQAVADRQPAYAQARASLNSDAGDRRLEALAMPLCRAEAPDRAALVLFGVAHAPYDDAAERRPPVLTERSIEALEAVVRRRL